MSEIYTEQMHLRQFVDNDLDNLFSLLGNPEVGQMLPKGQAYTKEEAKLWLNGFQRYWAKKNFGIWAVEHKSTNEFLGYCGLKAFPEFQEVEVLYSILQHQWGKGFATEAALASVAFGLHKLQLKKIIGLTRMDNPRSVAVLLKASLSFIKDKKIFGTPCKYYEVIIDN